MSDPLPERPSRLGRGLAALMGDVGEESAALARARGGPRRVSHGQIAPNPANPRKDFAEEDMAALAASVAERGVLQPILVRARSGTRDAYEIVAGERRWRAAGRAGLREVPVLVVEADDREALELAIIENVQRADLNPLEEARGYERLTGEFGHGAAELARAVGKSRAHVANTLRLLKLPAPVLDDLAAGRLTAGHARALLSLRDPEAGARRVIEGGLNVRAVERLAQAEAAPSPAPKPTKSPDAAAMERALGEATGLPVTLTHGPRGGELRIRFTTAEELEGLYRRLRR